MHLVRGNQKAALGLELVDQQPAKLALAGNVESIGGLIQNHQPRLGGETKSQQEFLLLPLRQRIELLMPRDLQLIEQPVELFVVEARIQTAEAFDEGGRLQ